MNIEGLFKSLAGKLFGDKQSRDMKRYRPKVVQINEIYAGLASLSDEQLRAKTDEFRARLKAGETLDDIVLEAFAVVKDACRRHCGQTDIVCGKPLKWNMIPYDVQLIAGLSLYEGNIAEQQTGEGKTLTAVLPLYTHALTGKGAHLITVNDYLAKRDCEWNKPIFEFLGLTVECIDYSEPHTPERRKAYLSDIVYGTNNEFGFDYLRDNMVTHKESLVQRELNFGIVDEVDSILIDEARTPLIISGAVERATNQFDKIKPMVERLVRKQFELVNEMVGEAQKAFEALEKGNRDAEWEVGRLLLLGRKGAPKHKRLMKVVADNPVVERYIGRVEREFMIEKKIHELEADLYYVIDEKGHNIDLTEKGRTMLAPTNPELFVLHDLVEAFSDIERHEQWTPEEKEEEKRKARVANEKRADELHNISQLLRAYSLYEKDVEYVVEENKVIIVDENTGRKMPGRRWSDGLHQAVEAKESVRVEAETQTLATITVQNFFRMYKRLAGMTGTAETEAAEFYHTYKMDVVVVPPNVQTRRVDYNDYIYRTKREKYNAVIEEILFFHKAKLPVLVGTVSVEVSELLSRMLRRTGVSHNVLNAKNHQREADIIADAGKPGQVTIATNMAGRGTDIKLQPTEDMIQGELDAKSMPVIQVEIEDEDGKLKPEKIPYGLQIIGSERHESRRIDRQLRGRSGRQGDAGSSQFFMALEDDLMRLFGSDRITGVMEKLGMKDGEPIQHRIITRAIEKAQKRIEGIHFGQRSQTLKYDDVMNKQRTAIYGLRRKILTGEEALGEDGAQPSQAAEEIIAGVHSDPEARTLARTILGIWYDAVGGEFFSAYNGGKPDSREWDVAGFLTWAGRHCPCAWPALDAMRRRMAEEPGAFSDATDLVDAVFDEVVKGYLLKASDLGAAMITDMTRGLMLYLIDDHWRAHLAAVDELREGIWMRGQAQLDPLIEYQREASILFDEMQQNINRDIFQRFFYQHVQIGGQAVVDRSMETIKADGASAADLAKQAAQGGALAKAMEKPRPEHRAQPKIGPNEPCPCGSGKKYKKCCGAPTVRAAKI